jgi:hypothetical protein
MTDIVRRDTDGWTDILPAVGDLAGKISGTEFVPESLRGKTAAVAAAILYGRELGLEPMTSLRSINVIKGKPTLSAEAMRAMVLAAGHDIRFAEMTAARCVIVGRRKGQEDSTTVTFTMDDAKKMGVGGGAQYSKMPRQMLAARATAELCRLIFADAIGGLMVDVEALDDVETTKVSAEPITTARRKKLPDAPAEPVAVAEPAKPTPVDPEPVLDDDIIEAEVIDDPEPEPAAPVDPVDLVASELGGEVVTEDNPRGPEMLRAALSEAKKIQKEPDGPITTAQLKALQASFKACGIDDRDERLKIARNLAGVLTLESASDLTQKQAKAVLDGLAFAQASDNPPGVLRALS